LQTQDPEFKLQYHQKKKKKKQREEMSIFVLFFFLNVKVSLYSLLQKATLLPACIIYRGVPCFRILALNPPSNIIRCLLEGHPWVISSGVRRGKDCPCLPGSQIEDQQQRKEAESRSAWWSQRDVQGSLRGASP
jgi:hypothetical protein